MNSRQQMEERLWDLIDGLCSPAERSALEELIAGDPEWQLSYQELLATHQSIAAAEPDMPSMRFTRNIMDGIARHRVAPATNSYINKHVIRGIAIFFLATLTGVFVYFLAQFKGSGMDQGSGIGSSGGNPVNDLPSPNWPSYDLSSYSHAFQNHLDKFNWGRIFNNSWLNIFILVNLILALMLLDRYLHRRKGGGHPGEVV